MLKSAETIYLQKYSYLANWFSVTMLSPDVTTSGDNIPLNFVHNLMFQL